MNVITRFAPSPTGVLHTGSARTALFNYLFAKKHNGKFMLRIEDTDQERSKPEYTQAIMDNLKWLGLSWNDNVVYQMQRSARHAEVANQLVTNGKAYRCYSTHEEIEEFHHKNPHSKFTSPWRDKDNSELPKSDDYVIRLKTSRHGSTIIEDLIQGEITVNHTELDDMVLLRSDATPTYMLAVIVDDFDMNITHIIRGDDHLTNAFRQKQIYDAMNWPTPKFAHIPLIHDKEGHKLSKRQGAMGVDNYIKKGYLPQAVVNHLLKLGWSHGDQEIFSIDEAIQLFNLEAIGKSPARFDIDKLNHINAHYLRELENHQLFRALQPFLSKDLNDEILTRINNGIEGLKLRSSTLVELAENAQIYISKQTAPDEKSLNILGKIDDKLKADITTKLIKCDNFNKDNLHKIFEQYAIDETLKFPFIMQSLRALILATFAAPGIFEVMEILGKEECLKRLNSNN